MMKRFMAKSFQWDGPKRIRKKMAVAMTTPSLTMPGIASQARKRRRRVFTSPRHS